MHIQAASTRFIISSSEKVIDQLFLDLSLNLVLGITLQVGFREIKQVQKKAIKMIRELECPMKKLLNVLGLEKKLWGE